MHPFWSMGYFQSKWGFVTSQHYLNALDKFNEIDFPLEGFTFDLDYMVNCEDFTINTEKMKIVDILNMTNRTAPHGVHVIPILNPGIAIGTQHAYESEVTASIAKKGLDNNVFIKSSRYKGKNLMGCVWPGKVFFPDFNNPNATQFWKDGMKMLSDNYQDLQFSGMWLDMNEFSNLAVGEIPEIGVNCYEII